MGIPRKVIPPLGLNPRTRATLLRSALPIPPDILMDGDIPRWIAGVTFQSFGCDPLSRFRTILCGEVEEGYKEGNELGDVLAFDSFTYIDGVEAALICTDIERADGDILLRMPSMVSAQLAAELMEGGARDFDEAEPLVNPSLASSASLVAGGPYAPNDAIALLEQALADFLHGAQGYLHLTPRGLSTINFLDQGVDVDGVWQTSQGHIVIADAGYSGPEPAANLSVEADEWWYASGPVAYALSEAKPIGEPWQRIDISTNQLSNIYEGAALVIFDPCGVVAVPVSYE